MRNYIAPENLDQSKFDLFKKAYKHLQHCQVTVKSYSPSTLNFYIKFLDGPLENVELKCDFKVNIIEK